MDQQEQRRRRDACPHCDPEHGDPRQKSWGVRVGPWVDGDDQPTYLLVQPSDGAHVAQSDAEWLWQLIRDHGAPASDLPEEPVREPQLSHRRWGRGA